MANTVSLVEIRHNPKVKTLIEAANAQMNAIGYTEHGFRHAAMVSDRARELITALTNDEKQAELAAVAGYLHDIGNAVNRNAHPETSGTISFVLLNEMGTSMAEIAEIIGAIGNHEEDQGLPVSAISSALIIADKSDVHHSRVQNRNPLAFDIHDRVNFSVQRSDLRVNTTEKTISLELITDEKSASVMEYFEIFLSRMLMCRRAADFFGYKFKLVINNVDM